jgi:hypothetical protein
MTRLTVALVVLALFDFPFSPAPDSEIGLPTLVRDIGSEIRPEQAMEFMRRVYATDRWFTFPKFQETAEYLKQTMMEMGLEHVEIVAAPADGVSQFGFWTMPLAWEAKQARLEIVDPAVPAESRILADYQKVPTSLGMWSGPTPPGGVGRDRQARPAQQAGADV